MLPELGTNFRFLSWHLKLKAIKKRSAILYLCVLEQGEWDQYHYLSHWLPTYMNQIQPNLQLPPFLLNETIIAILLLFIWALQLIYLLFVYWAHHQKHCWITKLRDFLLVKIFVYLCRFRDQSIHLFVKCRFHVDSWTYEECLKGLSINA